MLPSFQMEVSEILLKPEDILLGILHHLAFIIGKTFYSNHFVSYTEALDYKTPLLKHYTFDKAVVDVCQYLIKM